MLYLMTSGTDMFTLYFHMTSNLENNLADGGITNGNGLIWFDTLALQFAQDSLAAQDIAQSVFGGLVAKTSPRGKAFDLFTAHQKSIVVFLDAPVIIRLADTYNRYLLHGLLLFGQFASLFYA